MSAVHFLPIVHARKPVCLALTGKSASSGVLGFTLSAQVWKMRRDERNTNIFIFLLLFIRFA